MGKASVLKWTVPTTLLFLGTFCFYMICTSAAPFQSTLRLPRDRGCYYLMKHYANGERIETNEPCLNCTCVNSMLMCYLRICPFTKPAGPECVIRREEGECCPTVWCPGDAIPTPQPTEAPTTPEPMGCYAGGEAYVDGAQLPRNPDNPCEVCYCIRNSTACVMQDCELKVEGCTPVYREPSCCPSRYNCSRYVATTLPPGPMPTAVPTGCYVNNHLYADGERVVSENPCNHCYCMRDTVACAVEKCHAPGDGCIPQTVPEGQCCPDRYDCQGMEVAATDITTDEPHTTTPSFVSSEGDLTDRAYATKEETLQPFSVSSEVGTTISSLSADIEEIKLSSTPSQKDLTEESTTISTSEEETSASAVFSGETVGQSTLTTVPEEITQPATVPTEDEKRESSSLSTIEITSTEILKLSSLPAEDKNTSTLTPISEETTEPGGLTMAVQGFESSISPSSTTIEEKIDSASTTVTKEVTTAYHILSTKEAEEQITSTSSAGIITSTFAPEESKSSTLIEEEGVKLTAEMEKEDKITQIVTEVSEKTQLSEISTPKTSFNELSTPLELHISTDEVTLTLAPEQKMDTASSATTSESIVSKLDTKPTQITTLEEITAEAELSTTGTTTTARAILPGSIPGEGNCHYATGTYQNGDSVLPVHPCEKDCVCNNSVVACDIIVCEPLSEDSTNCRIITKQDECCPYYECDPTDHELPPALNQTKMHEIPEEAIPSTTISVETEFSEETTTEKPLEKTSTVESVKSTTMKEAIESTTERKEDSVTPFVKEATTKVSTVSQTEYEIEQVTGFTEQVTGLDERKAGTQVTDFDNETETISHEPIDTSSEIPFEVSKLPDVLLETKTSVKDKFTETTSVIDKDISKEITQFPAKVEVIETTSTEAIKYVTETRVTDESEKQKLDIGEHTEPDVRIQTELEVTTIAQTQSPVKDTTKEFITTIASTSTAFPKSTETLELIGDTKPAIQITDQIVISETSPTTTEEVLLDTTTKIAEELPVKEFDRTSEEAMTKHHTTEKSVSVSEQTTEPLKKVTTETITPEEKVTTEEEKAATTLETVRFFSISTQSPIAVQTEKAILLTEQIQETTFKTTSVVTDETIDVTSASSEPNHIEDTTLKPLDITTQTISKTNDTSDVVHKTTLIESSSKVIGNEITEPTLSTTDDKIFTYITDVETHTLQEITQSLPEQTSVKETSQPSETIPESTSKDTELSTEPETGITEDNITISLEEKTITKSLIETTKYIPDRIESDSLETTQSIISFRPTEPGIPSTQSVEFHRETSTPIDSSKSVIIDETTIALEATKLPVSTLPSKLDSKEIISTTLEGTGEMMTTTPGKDIDISDTTAKESAIKFDETTIAISQRNQTMTISDTTDISAAVTSDAEGLKTPSIIVPKPTSIETEIEVQPDTKPPLTEVVIGRYTTTIPITVQEESTTSPDFTFGVEVITGSSPEVQDQRTEAVTFTIVKSIETTVDDSKIATSLIDHVNETVYEDIIKLSTSSEIPEEETQTSLVKEDAIDKVTGSIELETQSTPSLLTEEISIAPTVKGIITTKLPKVSGVPGETTTQTLDEISMKIITEQEHLETTLTPKYVTAVTSAEEEEMQTEHKLDTQNETIMERTSSPEYQSTELLLNITQKSITETTKTVEEDILDVSEKTFTETSVALEEADVQNKTTSVSQPEIKPTEDENIEDTTSKQIDKVTEVTTLPEVLLVTTSGEELSETTISSITQEIKKETSQVLETTISTEKHQEEETTTHVSEKTTTHIASDKPVAETASTFDITSKVTTKLPGLGEITIQAIEDTTGDISTSTETISEELISRTGASEIRNYTIEEAVPTVSEDMTTKTSTDKMPDSTVFNVVDTSSYTSNDSTKIETKPTTSEINIATEISSYTSESRLTTETELHTSQGTEASVSLDVASHTVEKTIPDISVDKDTDGLDETTPIKLTDVSVEITSKLPEELVSTPPSKVLERTTGHVLHEDISTTTLTSSSGASEETSHSIISGTTSRLSEETKSSVITERTTQRVVVDLTSTTTEKSLEEITSTETRSKSTKDITTKIPEVQESTTSSVSKYTLLETTTELLEEKIPDVTVETEKALSSTTEKIMTKEPETESISEISKTITSELSTLLEVTSILPITSTEHAIEFLPNITEKADRLVTESTETQQTNADAITQTHPQPEVPSEVPPRQDITPQDLQHPMTDTTILTKEEEITDSAVPTIHMEISSTIQTHPQTEVPSEESHKQDITIPETSTEYIRDLTTEKETESAFSSTETQEVDVESTTQTHKQPEVPSEIPYKQDTTIKLETSKSPVEPITQSTVIHEETEKTRKEQMGTTTISVELEKSTAQPIITERLPIEEEIESVTKMATYESTEFTSLSEHDSTTLKFFPHLSTAQTILDRSTSSVTEMEKEDVEVSIAQEITTRPPHTKEQEKTTEHSFWTSWFSSSVPTTHVETSPEETSESSAATITKSTSSPKTESTDDSSEEPIFVQKGACVFNGIVYQSAEQIPRTDACEFCFCFRGDIICLHQGCPPPMTLCYEREVPGFCCPHYVCHSPKPLYNVSDHLTRQGRIGKRSVEVKGCEANGETYRVGENMLRYSTPCLQCKCDPNGSMTCEPQKCKPQEPLLLKLNKEFFRKRQ